MPAEYDSITPLGFSLWQLKSKDKVGAFQLYYDDNDTLQIGWKISCEYDYITAEHDCMIKASKYSFDCKRDVTDVYFTKIGLKIADAWCETLSWKYYFIEENRKNLEPRAYLLNSEDGSKLIFDKDYIIIGVKEVEDVGLFLMVEDTDDLGGMIIKILKNGSIKKTVFYDEVPTVIYGVDSEGMNEAQPIAFIGKREGKYFYIDAELKECEYEFKEISIQTCFEGDTENGRKNKVLTDYFTGNISE